MQSLFSFTGRLNRAKFWLILIVTDIAMVVLLGILMVATGGSMTMGADGSMPEMGGGVVGSLVALVIILAAVWIGLAVGVKRYRQTLD